MSISFGVGPVGYQEGLSEEKIREVAEKIDAETKAAGLPWWTGVFNPEIIKLAEIKRGECNCAAEATESKENDGLTEETLETKQFREMEEQRERIRRADELTTTAIRMEIHAMETLERLLDQEDTKSTLAIEYARNIAEAGNVVARLRGSMGGVPFYGYGV